MESAGLQVGGAPAPEALPPWFLSAPVSSRCKHLTMPRALGPQQGIQHKPTTLYPSQVTVTAGSPGDQGLRASPGEACPGFLQGMQTSRGSSGSGRA